MSIAADPEEQLEVLRDTNFKNGSFIREREREHIVEDPVGHSPPPLVRLSQLSPPRRREEDFDRADQMSLMTAYLDQRFNSIEQKLLKDAPQHTVDKFEYKGKSNKIQGEFNHTIKTMVSQAKTLLTAEGGLSVKRPIEILEDVEKRIAKRIKLIKIADKSAGGWSRVSKYDAERLGSDDEDENQGSRKESFGG